MKKIALLGSTGSIGTQTLDVIRHNKDKLSVHSLVAYSDTEKLAAQVGEFSPKYSALISRDGEECLTEAVKGADIAVVATKGITALTAILYCLDNGIDVALANKEALVCGGELVANKGGKLLPIDSEHCAIRRCLQNRSRDKIAEILLTASGGPFWKMSVEELAHVTPEQALQHPNWHMGSKITVDSATMMNKSLEVIEASFLFGVPVENIRIVVHRQSAVHSMVRFTNGEIMAQLAAPDMRLAIQTALLGDEGNFVCEGLDFTKTSLTFEQADFEKFPCSRLGYEIMRYPALCRTVMNAANDVCVESFLRGEFCFNDFYNIIMKAVDHFSFEAQNASVTIDNIKKFDSATKQYVVKLINGAKC